jgi:hypothetical protein
MIKQSSYQEDMKVLNAGLPNNKSSKYVKQNRGILEEKWTKTTHSCSVRSQGKEAGLVSGKRRVRQSK